MLAVDPDGTIHVVWYDTRAVDGGATNAEINLFYTSSTDGSDQFGGGFIGDYAQAADAYQEVLTSAKKHLPLFK